MTFEKFKIIVHKYYPQYVVSKHNEYTEKKTLSVSVQFNPNGKVYIYNGSYYNVAKKLNIPVISESVFNSQKEQLKYYIDNNGKLDELFNFQTDYTKEIEQLKEWFEQAKNFEII